MSIGFGFPVTTIRNCYTSVNPIKIDIDEDYTHSNAQRIDGLGRHFQKPSAAEITLEFDAMTDDELKTFRIYLYNRFYEKKIFLNEPATNQVFDHLTHDANNWIKYATSATYPGTLTELTSGEYGDVATINTAVFEYGITANNYGWIVFQYDISAFINAYGAAAIDRMTLFLHNPYTVMVAGGLPQGVRAFCYNRTRSEWTTIGDQTYTVADANLRAVNRINQQYFSLKKRANFTNISDYINATDKTVKFAICNVFSAAGVLHNMKIGFNYAALAINGYPVKQSNPDNFTYRNSYTGSGNVGTIVLNEV